MAWGPFNAGGGGGSSGGTAADISYDNSKSGISAANVQEAIDALSVLTLTIQAVPAQSGSLTYTGSTQSPTFIPFEVIERKFSNRYEALAWICKNQLGRRNLTPEQKKFLIGKQAEAEKQIKSFHGNQYTLAPESGLVQNEPNHQKHGSRSKVAAENGTSESYVYRAEQFAKGVEAAEEAVPGVQEEILSGKIRATDREISSIAKIPKKKRPEVVAELRKPKAERNSSITDSYSSPSKDNEFIKKKQNNKGTVMQ